MEKEEFYDAIQKVIARTWAEPDFREALKSDARPALKEMGVDVPEGVKINISEDTENVWNLVLPPSPEIGGVEELDVYASAGSSSCGRCASTYACDA